MGFHNLYQSGPDIGGGLQDLFYQIMQAAMVKKMGQQGGQRPPRMPPPTAAMQPGGGGQMPTGREGMGMASQVPGQAPPGRPFPGAQTQPPGPMQQMPPELMQMIMQIMPYLRNM